jgi:hypothetical protein
MNMSLAVVEDVGCGKRGDAGDRLGVEDDEQRDYAVGRFRVSPRANWRMR